MARPTEPWLPDTVAQAVGDWSLHRRRRPAEGQSDVLEGEDATFAREVGRALVEAGLNGPRRTETELRKAERAFFVGLTLLSYLTTSEETPYLWSLLERPEVRDDRRRVFRTLDVLLDRPNAQADALRRMLALDLGRSAEGASRDALVGSILEDDDGPFDEAIRREVAAWVVGDDFKTATRREEKRLRSLARKAVER